MNDEPTTASNGTDGRSVIVADQAARAEATSEDDGGLLLDDLLVEEVSIDGMCGVY